MATNKSNGKKVARPPAPNGGRNKVRFQSTLDAAVYLEAKVRSVRDGASLNTVIENLLRQWLENKIKT